MLPTDPLEQVREGMDVVDQSGARLGKVARVQVALPTETTHPPDSDLLDEVVDIVPSPPEMSEDPEAVGASPWGHDPSDLPDLPDPVLEHLRHAGFIEVDGIDLTDAQRYIAADHIRSIGQNQVVVSGRAEAD